MMDGTNKNNVNINDENYYPFCLTPSEHTLVYLPSEQRGGGWKDIKAASVPLIIEYITRIDYHDSGFIHDLLLTHRDFATPEQFFELLMKRFIYGISELTTQRNEPPPNSALQEQKDQFEQEKAFIRSSTILIIRRWIPNLRPSDFVIYPELYEKVLSFINATHDDYHSELFALLWKAKTPSTSKSLPEPKLVHSGASTMRIVQQPVLPRVMSSPPPLSRTSSILSFHLSPRSLERMNSTRFYDTDSEAPPSPSQYSPEQIAKELTVLDQEYFSAINAHEFVGQAWSNNSSDAPNIVNFTKWFNRLSNWMVTKVVSKESPEQRAAVIEGFISIAMNFLELKNYSGLMAAFSSLHNAAISRLKQTWHLVSAKSKADLELVEFILNPAKNFKNYRKILQEVYDHPDQPCIPVVGIFLTDTTFMYENPPLINGLVNVPRVFLLGEKIKQFLLFQKHKYTHLTSMEQLRESILSERICDENECFNLSKLREENGNTPPLPGSSRRRSGHPPSKLRMMDLSTDEVTDSASSSLSERDWQILLTGAKELRFATGSIIFDEGDNVTRIYKIISGKVRRRTSNSGLISGLSKKNQVLGDSAFINSGVSLYRAVAEKETTVLAIDTTFITNMFDTDSDLAATFYKTTSVSLAYMYKSGLKAISSINPLSLSSEDSLTHLNLNAPDEDDHAKSQQDLVFCSKFGLPEDEVLIKEHPCKHSSLSGVIYISQHFICFYGSVFGLSKQKAFSFADITRVEKIEKTLVLNKVNSKKAVQKFTFKTIQELREVYSLVLSIWKTQLQSPLKMSSSPSPHSPNSPSITGRSGVKSLLPTREEWEMLLKGSKLQSFKKGEIIVPEGVEHRKLYQIFQGKCSVEKEVEGSANREIVNLLKENDLYGEIAFVLNNYSQTSLVAQTDVEIHVLEASFVHALLNLRPNLAPKFYRYVGESILKRLIGFRDKTNFTITNSPAKPV